MHYQQVKVMEVLRLQGHITLNKKNQHAVVTTKLQCNISIVTVSCTTKQKARSSVYCIKLTVTVMLELTLAGLADCAKQMRAAAATGRSGHQW